MNEKIDLFAIVELFGHSKIAGKITEQSIGPATFIRVDVPETERQPSFSRLLNPSAIYAINPVTEDVMKHMASTIQTQPIQSWDVKKMQEKMLLLVNKQPVMQPDMEDDEEDNDRDIFTT